MVAWGMRVVYGVRVWEGGGTEDGWLRSCAGRQRANPPNQLTRAPSPSLTPSLNPSAPPMQAAALAATAEQLPSFGPQALAMLLWGLATAQMAPSPQLASSLPAAVEQLLWRSSIGEAATMLRALCALGVLPQPRLVAAVAARAAEVLQRQAPALAASAAAAVAEQQQLQAREQQQRRGAAAAAAAAGGGRGEGGERVPYKAWGHARGGAARLPRHLALLVWTLGSVVASSDSSAAAARDAGDGSGAAAAGAHAAACRRELEPLLPALAAAAEQLLPACCAVDLVQLAVGCALLRYSPGPRFWQAHQAACLAVAGDMRAPMWRQLQQAYARLRVAPQRGMAASFLTFT